MEIRGTYDVNGIFHGIFWIKWNSAIPFQEDGLDWALPFDLWYLREGLGNNKDGGELVLLLDVLGLPRCKNLWSFPSFCSYC